MSQRLPEWDKYLLGSVLFLSLLIGGGTASGLISDVVIEVTAIVSLAIVLAQGSRQTSPPLIRWLLILIVMLMVVQLVPMPFALLQDVRPPLLQGLPWLADKASFRFISIGVGRSVEALLFVLVVAAFFLGVLRLRIEQVYALLPFLFMGVICNGLAGAIQFSLSDEVAIKGLLPFTINAGFFANRNHFSALLFVSIPLIVYYGLFRGRLLSGALGLIAVLVLLLATGSRAGTLIGLAITVISIVFLSSRSRASGFGILAIFIGLSIYTMGAWTKLDAREVDPAFGRAEFARTTIDGIKDNWVTGIGFGNFQKAYQIYEKEGMIYKYYVNHAHNDYLEIVFEGGIVAAFLVAFYILLLVAAFVRNRREPLQRAAFLSVFFLLVHSLVDYPLRTMALAMTFAFMNAIIFHKGFADRPAKKANMVEVDHNGGKLLVPVEATS